MKKFLIPLTLIALLSLASCKKTCRCYGYDGTTTDYTSEEISAEGTTCASKIFLDGLAARRYAYCEWDF